MATKGTKLAQQRDHASFRLSLLELARCLARLQPTPWSKVAKLMDSCPWEVSRGVFSVDQRGQDAVVSLSVYLLESGYQYRERIVPYLLKLMRGLLRANFVEEVKYDPEDRVPVRERFCFLLHTVLSDVAYHREDLSEEIVDAQLDLLGSLVRICASARSVSMASTGHSSTATAINVKLATTVVPLLLGTCRALGRASFEPPFLVCRIFPPPEKIDCFENELDAEGYLKRKRRQSEVHDPILVPRRAMVDYWMVKMSQGPVSKDRRQSLVAYGNVITPIAFNASAFFLGTVGSCFSQARFSRERRDAIRKEQIRFSLNKIQAILSYADRMLSDEMIQYLDMCALEGQESGLLSVNPYRSFGEVLKQVWTSLLQELLIGYPLLEREQMKSSSPLIWSLARDVQKLAKHLFVSGQKDIQLKAYDASEREQKMQRRECVHRFRSSVQTVATCLDILAWAETDETGADMLCGKLVEKLSSTHGLKLALGVQG